VTSLVKRGTACRLGISKIPTGGETGGVNSMAQLLMSMSIARAQQVVVESPAIEQNGLVRSRRCGTCNFWQAQYLGLLAATAHMHRRDEQVERVWWAEA
jgi:hypothetical protein